MKPVRSRTPPAHVEEIVRELTALGKEDKNHLVRHTTLPVVCATLAGIYTLGVCLFFVQANVKMRLKRLVENTLKSMLRRMQGVVQAGFIAAKTRQSEENSLEECVQHGTDTLQELERLGGLEKDHRTVITNKNKFHSLVAEVRSVAPHYSTQLSMLSQHVLALRTDTGTAQRNQGSPYYRAPS